MSGGQALAALGAAARKDMAAIFCRHPRPEAMAAFADKAARLKCAFHVILQTQAKNQGPLYRGSPEASQLPAATVLPGIHGMVTRSPAGCTLNVYR
jgi:hypothetical protein